MTKNMLCAHFPIAKKKWNMCVVENNLDLERAVETACENLGDYCEKMIEMRIQHPRAFKRAPKFIKFIILRCGNPKLVKTKKLGEFDIFLDKSEPPRIVVPWF